MEYDFYRSNALPSSFTSCFAVSEKGEIYLPWFTISMTVQQESVFLAAMFDGVEIITCPRGDHFYPLEWIKKNTAHKKSELNAYLNMIKNKQNESEAGFKIN